MTNAARIEFFDRDGKRLRQSEGFWLCLRFPIGMVRDREKSIFVLNYVQDMDMGYVPEGAYLITAAWSSAENGVAKSTKFTLVFRVNYRDKKIRLV